MGKVHTLTYEDIILAKMRPQGVVFLSLMVLEGPHITKFIAPQVFMDVYLKEALYNKDPSLIVPEEDIGFYKWTRFIDGEEITNFLKENFHATGCESLVLIVGKKRIVLTIGYKKEFSLSDWFFKENPNFDYLFE
jgi:hypothetical protein